MESDKIIISSVDLKCCNFLFETDIVFKLHRNQMHGEKFQKPKWMLQKIDQTEQSPTVPHGDGGESNTEQGYVDFHSSTFLKCPYCGIQLSSPKTTAEHIKMVHTGAILKCPNCEFQSRRKYDIKAHYKRMHTEHGNTTCQFCGKVFKKIKEHLKGTLCGKDKGDRDKTTCEQCGIIVKTKSKYRHIKQVHGKVKDKQCTQCHYATYDNFNLRLHVSKVHLGKSLEYENCPHCSERTSNLKRHIDTYHNEHLSNE